jgi:hypothetical protein
MFYSEHFGIWSIELWEWLLAIIYIIAIVIIADYVRKKNSHNSIYRYYLRGLTFKMFSGILFACIYIFYYKGGDTIMYYESAWAMVNLLLQKPYEFFHILFGEATTDKVYYFDASTGYPLRYMYKDPQTFGVVRFLSPVLFLSCKSYIVATVMFSWLSYFGIWKLFMMYSEKYPLLTKQLAWGILFIPSVLFWGSGILKDTITLSAACWYVYSLHNFFLKRISLWRNAILIFLSAFVIVIIKPYIFIALLPASLLWILLERVLKNQKKSVIVVALPVTIVLSVFGGITILSLLSSNMSKFSPDKIFETAKTTQKDLKSEYYSKNSFDIGEFDESAGSLLGLAPTAIVAGLFRPFIWECNNIVMVFSGLENLALLGFTIVVLFTIRPRRLINIILGNPLLLFGLVFSIIFAFALGLTTSNFGALVRFKIPAIPFFVCSLVILNYFIKNKKQDSIEVSSDKRRL